MDQHFSFWWDSGKSFKLIYHLHQYHLPLETQSEKFVLSYPSQVVVSERSNPHNDYEIQVGYSISASQKINILKYGSFFSPIFALWIDSKNTIESKDRDPSIFLSLNSKNERIRIQVDEYNYFINENVFDHLSRIRSDDDVKISIFRILLGAFRHRNGGDRIRVDLLKNLVVPCWFEYQQTINILDELGGQGYLGFVQIGPKIKQTIRNTLWAGTGAYPYRKTSLFPKWWGNPHSCPGRNVLHHHPSFRCVSLNEPPAMKLNDRPNTAHSKEFSP